MKFCDVDKLGEAVFDFHSERLASELEEIQLNNRKLWLDFLCVENYYSYFCRCLDPFHFEEERSPQVVNNYVKHCHQSRKSE